MAPLHVPASGLSLCRDRPNIDPTKPTQFVQLDLAQNTLDDLIQSLRDGQPARLRLGKHQILYYGSSYQSLRSSPKSHPSEIYSCTSDDKENLYFAGTLSHSLEVQEAKEATAATDQALATLEQSLNAFERGKEEKQTHLLTDSEARALKPGDRRHKALAARRPASKVELERDRLFKSIPSRSASSSPGLGSSRSPTVLSSITPTSVPPPQDKAQRRLDALKVPFIHLLAIRPASAKLLAEQTRSPIDDCLTLSRKYGIENRDHRGKFDLRDKVYRELDIWKFPYPSEHDREQAVKNAVSAFDRMRVSRSDKLWQMLLPTEERGKGKCLSRLDLRTGPFKKSPTARTLSQSTDSVGKDGYCAGPEGGRVINNEQPKPTTSILPRYTPTEKRQNGAAASVKRTTKGKNINSTLTGRVTKKTERKSAQKGPDGSKFKSAEYVQDSDDDSDASDVSTEKTGNGIPPSRSQGAKRPPKPESKPAGLSVRDSDRSPTAKINKPEFRKTESLRAVESCVASKRPRLGSGSSRRPSPLDSPTTSASDIRTDKRLPADSSVSPAALQAAKTKQASVTPTVKRPIVPNSAKIGISNPLKRKAEAERPSAMDLQSATLNGTVEHKKRRDMNTSSGSSDSASPPLGQEILFQQLREKSQKFKHYYSKYKALYSAMAAHVDPPRGELERLQRQHARLQRMKKEIWDEDRRLRERIDI